MTNQIRIGILGCGSVAVYAVIEPARNEQGVAVTAVASRDVTRAGAYAEAHGIPRAVSYEELLADPDIDVVYVALPNNLHSLWSIRAMEAGKHVLCEKPMASNAVEARNVVAAMQRTGRIYLEAVHWLHHPLWHRVRDIVDSGEIGPVTRVESRLRMPSEYVPAGNVRLRYDLAGGALMDSGCYPVSLVRQCLGEPESIVSVNTVRDPDDPQIDIDISAEMRFAGGETALIEASFISKTGLELGSRIIGTKGVINVDALWAPNMGGRLVLTTDGRTIEEAADPTSSYTYQARELMRIVREGVPVATAAMDGVANMSLIDNIYRAAGLKVRGE